MSSHQNKLLDNAIICINKFLTAHNVKEIGFICVDADALSIRDSIQNLSEELLKLITDPVVNEPPEIDSEIVQITATNEQLNERINAFMSHAQNLLDEQNVKEFCDVETANQNLGCARTDACYKPRTSQSTHMQVSKAKNVEGPQLRITSQGLWRIPESNKSSRKQLDNSIPQPIAERLHNLESHLDLQTVEPSDVYCRLKNLENRILSIEGTSPEYFNAKPKTLPSSASNLSKSDPRDFTLQEIDDRIRKLKQDLHVKKRKMMDGLEIL